MLSFYKFYVLTIPDSSGNINIIGRIRSRISNGYADLKPEINNDVT